MKILLALFILLIVTPVNSVCAQQAPEIPASIKGFWSRLAKAKTLTYTARVWRPQGKKEGEVGSTFALLNTYEVIVQRPNRLRITGGPPREEETYEKGRLRHTFFGGGANILISDGKTSLSLDSQLRTYNQGKPVGSLDKRNIGLPSTLYMEWIFDKDPMYGFKPSSDRLFPKGYAVYTFTDLSNSKRLQKIYFDLKTGELIRSSIVEIDEKGEANETDRVEFRFWDFDPPLAASTFDTRPPRIYQSYEKLMKSLNLTQGK